jgi:hypothetical protein
MKNQVVYETNADWFASYEAMVKNPLVSADKTEKGLLWFKFKDNPTVFQLTPTGKLQVKWNDVSEKKTLLRLLKNLLVARPNERLKITPQKQQIWITYPVPESFKLYWCDEETEFVRKKPPECAPGFVQTRSFGVGEMLVPPLQDILRTEAENSIRIIEEARRELKFFREPTVEEIAAKIGCLPEAARFMLNELVHSRLTDWKEQSDQEAQKEARDSINLAAWLFWEKKGQQTMRLRAFCEKVKSEASPSVRKRAEDILQNYPDLVPKVIVETAELNSIPSKRAIGRGIVVPVLEDNWVGVQWPDETNIRWRQIFHRESPKHQYWNA